MTLYPKSKYEDLWNNVSLALKTSLSSADHVAWILPLVFKEFQEQDQILTVVAPSSVVRLTVRQQFEVNILHLWEYYSGEKCHLHIEEDTEKTKIVIPCNEMAETSISVMNTARTFQKKFSPSSPHANYNDILNIKLNPYFTFEWFVTGKPNQLAYAACQRIATGDPTEYNPLFLYGGVGLGKTHLMHATAHEIKRILPEKKMAYFSAEKFMHFFVRSIRDKNTSDFRNVLRSVDILMIDDIQFIGGKDSTQEEFFHTFNALIDHNSQIILSADKSPKDLDDLSARLKSRLSSGLIADIHPLTFEMRIAILEKKSEMIQLDLPYEIIQFLASKLIGNVREIEGALKRLKAHIDLIGRQVHLNMVQDVLEDLLQVFQNNISIYDIQKKVCSHFHILMSDMMSKNRSRNIALPRQVAMYIAKQLTDHSYNEIGNQFNKRDHTTIMHGIKRIEKLLHTDKALHDDITFLLKILEKNSSSR